MQYKNMPLYETNPDVTEKPEGEAQTPVHQFKNAIGATEGICRQSFGTVTGRNEIIRKRFESRPVIVEAIPDSPGKLASGFADTDSRSQQCQDGKHIPVDCDDPGRVGQGHEADAVQSITADHKDDAERESRQREKNDGEKNDPEDPTRQPPGKKPLLRGRIPSCRGRGGSWRRGFFA